MDGHGKLERIPEYRKTIVSSEFKGFKSMMPLISIVVPVYNVAPYLDKCVCSILKQTYTNIEVILVDDGSTDASASLCNRYAVEDDRVRIIRKANGGLVTARKTGFAAASGDYIMSVDGDDWIEPVMCENLFLILKKSGAECVVSGFIHEMGNGTEKRYSLNDNFFNLDNTVRATVIENWLLGKHEIFSPVWAKLYPADLIRNSYANVPDYMNLGEDQANFVNLIAMATSIVCTNEIYYHYVYRKESYDNTISPHEFVNQQSYIFYCRNCILKKFENVNSQIIDDWVMGGCLKGLKRFFVGEDYIFLRYFYPNSKELIEKKVIIYGAGSVGKSYYCQLCRYEAISIVGWVDKNFSAYNYEWKKIEPVTALLSKKYDYVLLAVKAERLARQIEKELVEIGIPKERVLWREPSSICEKNRG